MLRKLGGGNKISGGRGPPLEPPLAALFRTAGHSPANSHWTRQIADLVPQDGRARLLCSDCRPDQFVAAYVDGAETVKTSPQKTRFENADVIASRGYRPISITPVFTRVTEQIAV